MQGQIGFIPPILQPCNAATVVTVTTGVVIVVKVVHIEEIIGRFFRGGFEEKKDHLTTTKIMIVPFIRPDVIA